MGKKEKPVKKGNAVSRVATAYKLLPQAEVNQLVALFNARCYLELENRARSLLERYPTAGFAWKALGSSLQMQGKDALHALRKATELLPDDADTHSNLGNALQNLGQPEGAAASCRRALEINPNLAVAHHNLGNALKDLGQLDAAVASYRRALLLKPNYAEAHYNLGNALQSLGRLNDAVASYRRALEIKPDYSMAHNNLGNALKDLGQIDDALASFRNALSIKPDHANAYSNLLFLSAFHALLAPQEYLALARGWEKACVPEPERRKASNKIFQRQPLAGRRLKVGYVSGDYRHHPVSFNIEQVFANHDRSRIELFAYSNCAKRDEVTVRLQLLVEHWVSIVGISDDAVCDRIGADGIDVLIDLSGHTSNNRMGVFARRAAPVQAYYLGYFASTGLTEMDYLIGDDILTPPETDNHFSEQVWRLHRIWHVYNGKTDMPVPGWQPSQDGTVWLGSFNNLNKLTPATLALWAKILHAMPEAKLLLKTKELSDARNCRRILEVMSGHGILPDRVELRDSSATPSWQEHMAYYGRLDIALDPVGGMGGGITTCDALWMGAPVITLEGDRYASRVTATLLNALGRTEWIAHSEAEYVHKAVALARDVEQRKALRSTQRERMASCPVLDARGLTALLENAYFEMFERWVERKNGEPPK